MCKLIKKRSEITEVEMPQSSRAKKQAQIQGRHSSTKTLFEFLETSSFHKNMPESV